MSGRARGLTLVELVLAVGLLSLLMVATFQLLERSLSVWERGEVRRGLLERATSVSELLASDLAGVEGGARGDLLAEWVGFDTTGDGLRDTFWPRVRLVRQASAADVARALEAAEPRAAGAEDAEPELVEERFPDRGPGHLEVVWCVLPIGGAERDAASEGVLWRGVRVVGDPRSDSFFDPTFFGADGRPRGGALTDASGGVLWLGLQFASQTSVVNDGWSLGPELADASASWDAWAAGRPDLEVHAWNAPPAGMPPAGEHALLPRRVRIELELERPEDRRRRTRLTGPLEPADRVLRVDDGARLPRGEEPGFVKVDGEWMEVLSVDGDRAQVRRGARGTQPVPHEAGRLVHHGARLVREVPLALYREDWDL